eukprot:sb/3475796/
MPGSPVTLSSRNANIEIWILRAFHKDWPTTKEPTETSKQPIRTRYLDHVTGYQPIREHYFLIRSIHARLEIYPSHHIARSRVPRFIVALSNTNTITIHPTNMCYKMTRFLRILNGFGHNSAIS